MDLHSFPDFGPHCTFLQATKSATGIAKGILNNIPTKEQYNNMTLVYNHVIVPVATHYGIDPAINSFFRNQATNKAVGGSLTSQHMTGQAVDLDYDLVKNKLKPSNTELFNWIKKNLDYDQMIYEFYNPDGSPAWVHVSYVGPGKNRQMRLRAVKVKGKTEYQHIP